MIATRTGLVVLRRRDFREPQDAARLERALLERIAARADGGLLLERMARIDDLARSPAPRLAVPALLLLCGLGFALQLSDPFAMQAGSLIPSLVAAGELWRIVTANFLHDVPLFPIHLGLNLVCLVVFGSLVEHVLGARRTLLVMGASAILSMLACAAAGYPEVIGASGIAAGLAGALLCLELRHSRLLPATWRLPRRLFVGALLAQALVDLAVPWIAAAAHLGGFAAGYLVARPLAAPALQRRREGPWVTGLAAAVVAVLLAALLAVAPLVRREAAALERHALRLLESGGASPGHDNDLAWLIVTETQASPEGLRLALALAERAVAGSGRPDPDVLDTLAEARFAAGDREGALAAIDQAIALAEGEAYFTEQRRRFLGERAAGDRPAPPELPWGLRSREQSLIAPDASSLTL